MKNLLVSFCMDFGRMGHINGLFICTEAELENLVGNEVYFGEVLGKHSEVYGTVHKEYVEVLSDDQEKIAWLESLNGRKTISGYNPIHYVRDDNDEECYDSLGEVH